MVKGKSQVVVQVDSHEGNIASYCACKIAQCASSLAICASSLAPLYKLPFVRGPSPSPIIILLLVARCGCEVPDRDAIIKWSLQKIFLKYRK